MQEGQFMTAECKKCLHWSTTHSSRVCWRCRETNA